MAKYLIDNGAVVEQRNINDLNSLDISIIHGLYNIAYYLVSKDLLIPKQMDEYLEIAQVIRVPYFNLPLFFQNLTDRVDPEKVPSFTITNDEKKSI